MNGISLPDGWSRKTLSDLATINYGRDPSDILNADGPYPVYGTSGNERRGTDFLYDGDSIILGRKGTIDRIRYATGRFWAIDTAYYLSKFNDAVPKWLFYFLGTVDLRSLNEATGVPSLSRDLLYRIKVPTPPRTEQLKIAEVLSTIDREILLTEALIAKRQRIKSGLLHDLLTLGVDNHGKLRSEQTHAFKDSPLGRIPAEWDVVAIDEVALITTGDKDTQDADDSGEYPFFVRSQTIERIPSFSFDEEAVLTAGDGVGVGKVFHYYKGRFDCHQRVYCLHSFAEDIIGYFFFQYFRLRFISRVSQFSAKGSVDSVRREMISKMLVPMPKRDEQELIASILLAAERAEIQYSNNRVKLVALKAGLLQDLLTGKRRTAAVPPRAAFAST